MKVLVLGSKEYPTGTNKGDDPLPSGGIETYVNDLTPELAKRCEIIVITRKFRNTKCYEKINNVEVYRVPWVKGFYFRNPSFNFSAFLKALHLKFDIILSQGPVSTFFGIFLSKIKRKPLISVPHGISLQQPQYKKIVRYLFKFLERFAYSKSSYVIFLSGQEKEEFRKKLGLLPNYKVIPTGIKLRKIRSIEVKKIRKELGLRDKIVITFTGRLIKVKGLQYLVEAVSKLRDEKFKVLIGGNGPERNKLEELVKNLSLNNVIFTGWRDDIPEILKLTDIFVLPSISEGLPVALLEAMSVKKACIVTDIGLPIQHMKTGIVVPPKNSKAIEEAIELLIKKPELKRKLGENARRWIKKNCTLERVAKRYIEVFKEILKI